MRTVSWEVPVESDHLGSQLSSKLRGSTNVFAPGKPAIAKIWSELSFDYSRLSPRWASATRILASGSPLAQAPMTSSKHRLASLLCPKAVATFPRSSAITSSVGVTVENSRWRRILSASAKRREPASSCAVVNRSRSQRRHDVSDSAVKADNAATVSWRARLRYARAAARLYRADTRFPGLALASAES